LSSAAFEIYYDVDHRQQTRLLPTWHRLNGKNKHDIAKITAYKSKIPSPLLGLTLWGDQS
jgi:hypothetical protein